MLVPQMLNNQLRATSITAKWWRDFVWLLFGEILTLRLEWFWYLVQVSFGPLAYMMFLWFLLRPEDQNVLAYILSGSLVTSLCTGAMLSLGQHIGWLKDLNAYEYYAALPLSKSSFVFALATRGVVLALPSTVIVLGFGRLVFGLAIDVAIAPVLLLCAYSLSGLGAVIGFYSPTAEAASMGTQVLSTILVFFAPVFLPLEHLPKILQRTSLVLPTTYAASAVRSVMGTGRGFPWRDIAVLAACTLVSLVLIPRKLDWRSR